VVADVDLAGADDLDLVRVLDREPAAVEEFYRRHVRPLTRHVSRVLNDPHDTADVVAATFIVAIESACHFDPARGTARAWLRGIAGNLIAGGWRRRAAEARAVSRLRGQRHPVVDDYGQVDERIDALERAGPALAVLPSLPPAERELVNLILYGGLSVTEAAAELGIRPGTARMRLARARSKLVQALGKGER